MSNALTENLKKINYNKVKILNEREIICQVKEEEIPKVLRILIENRISVFNVIPERSLEDYFMSLV